MKNKMKHTKLIYLFIAAMLCSASSCHKTEVPYGGVSVYKTRGDYFDKLNVGIKNNKIFRTPSFFSSIYRDSEKKIPFTEDTAYKLRKKLVNDYVLESGGNLKYDAFLDISFKELFKMKEQYGENYYICIDTAWKHILDRDPYTEFYRVKDNEMFRNLDGSPDTTGLNQIILDGQLEKYFNKLK